MAQKLVYINKSLANAKTWLKTQGGNKEWNATDNSFYRSIIYVVEPSIEASEGVEAYIGQKYILTHGQEFNCNNTVASLDGLNLKAASANFNGTERSVYSTSEDALPTIYAPTSAGTAGQVVVSTGDTPTYKTLTTTIAKDVTTKDGTDVDNLNIPTVQAVYEAIQSALTSAMVYKGAVTPAADADSATLVSDGVTNGDIRKIDSNGYIKPSDQADPVAVRVGDLVIAKVDEDGSVTWDVIPSGNDEDADTTYTFAVDGTTEGQASITQKASTATSASTIATIKAGDNITVTEASGVITIAGGSTNVTSALVGEQHKTAEVVDGAQLKFTEGTADTIIPIVGGDNVTVTYDSTTGISIASTDTNTWRDVKTYVDGTATSIGTETLTFSPSFAQSTTKEIDLVWAEVASDDTVTYSI